MEIRNPADQLQNNAENSHAATIARLQRRICPPCAQSSRGANAYLRQTSGTSRSCDVRLCVVCRLASGCGWSEQRSDFGAGVNLAASRSSVELPTPGIALTITLVFPMSCQHQDMPCQHQEWGCHCWLVQQCKPFDRSETLLDKPAVAPARPPTAPNHCWTSQQWRTTNKSLHD